MAIAAVQNTTVLVLWRLGLVSGHTIGAFIRVLLVIAVVLFLVGVVSSRRIARAPRCRRRVRTWARLPACQGCP